MDFEFSDKIRDQRKLIRQFVETEVDPFSLEIEKNAYIPEHIIERMKELGLFGLSIPQEYGGLGLSRLEQSAIYEELGRTNSCIRTYMGSNNGPGVECIMAQGTEEQKRKYLPCLALGDSIAAFAVSEPNTGSEITGIQCEAKKEENNFVLDGSKVFITMGDIADIIIVLAYTNREWGLRDGLTLFTVKRGFPGYSTGHIDEKMGLRGSNTCELLFNNCIVPEGNVIGQMGKGFKIAVKAIDGGRLTITAVAIGAASKLLDLSIAYSKQKGVKGGALGSSQAIQVKLADMAIGIYASRNMLYNAAWMVDKGEAAVKEAAMAKVFSTEMANRVAHETLQIFGEMAYVRNFEIERMIRDVRILTIYEGTSEMQRFTVARYLLKS